MNNSILLSFYNFLIGQKAVKNKSDFAKKLDYGRQYTTEILNGTKEITDEFKIRLINVFKDKWQIFQGSIIANNASHYLDMMQQSNIVNDTETEYNSPNIIKNKTGAVYEELSDGSYIIKVDLVPFEAHAKYLFDDVQEAAEWQKVSFIVDRIGRGKYLAFRHKGESMFNEDNPSFYDTPNGALSLCRELGRQHWRDGFYKDGAPYGWILVTNKNILHKDITDFDHQTGDITCHSRNPSPEYSDFKLNLDDVHQIFKIVKRTF